MKDNYVKDESVVGVIIFRCRSSLHIHIIMYNYTIDYITILFFFLFFFLTFFLPFFLSIILSKKRLIQKGKFCTLYEATRCCCSCCCYSCVIIVFNRPNYTRLSPFSFLYLVLIFSHHTDKNREDKIFIKFRHSYQKNNIYIH